MSKTKAGGSSKNNRDSAGKRLGVKLYGGQKVRTGGIIIRQIGMTKTPGKGVRMAKDYTIYAEKDGVVEFKKINKLRFTGSKVPRVEVSVV